MRIENHFHIPRAEILAIDPCYPQPDRIARAAERIRQGQVIAIPTDTFYGLAADPFNLSAVETVFALKGRQKTSPLLLLVNSLEMAIALSRELPPPFYRLAEQFWPGPLTLVVEASPRIPDAVTARAGRVGLRVPAAAIPLALIQATGGPITATSANLSGEKECRSASQVEASLGDRLALILDGGTASAAHPSTVVGLWGTSWEVIREGAISQSLLADCLHEMR